MRMTAELAPTHYFADTHQEYLQEVTDKRQDEIEEYSNNLDEELIDKSLSKRFVNMLNRDHSDTYNWIIEKIIEEDKES